MPLYSSLIWWTPSAVTSLHQVCNTMVIGYVEMPSSGIIHINNMLIVALAMHSLCIQRKGIGNSNNW